MKPIRVYRVTSVIAAFARGAARGVIRSGRSSMNKSETMDEQSAVRNKAQVYNLRGRHCCTRKRYKIVRGRMLVSIALSSTYAR